jgi:plasmid stability protein
MRTTVTINDHLLAEAKLVAARSHRSLGEVIEDALRRALNEPPESEPARVTLPAHGSGGLQPGVDLEDKEQLADLLGDNEPRRAAS